MTSEPVSPLMLEFLSWVSSRRRTYAKAMEAWRTACPRHTVWEDALEDRLVQVQDGVDPRELTVILTSRGHGILDARHGDDTTHGDRRA